MSKKNEILVLKIIDDYKLVISVGSEHGVKKNQQFLIYSIDPDPIRDPRTNEILGELEIVKGKGIATHVQPKFTTIESNEFEFNRKKIRKNPKNSIASFHYELFATEETEESKEHLPFSNAEVGDFAKLI
nr:hypothetical protein [[Eubacterium] tenue]